MTEPLVTTCAGFSLQKVGGRCSRRNACVRYAEHKESNGYPQENHLCAVGKWDWFYPIHANEKDIARAEAMDKGHD